MCIIMLLESTNFLYPGEFYLRRDVPPDVRRNPGVLGIIAEDPNAA